MAPFSPAIALGPVSAWPFTTMPAPTPVPMITPNTTRAPAAAPIHRFGKRKAIRIVLDANGASQQLLQIIQQRLAVHAHGVGIFKATGGTRNGARSADADGAFTPQFGLDPHTPAPLSRAAWPSNRPVAWPRAGEPTPALIHQGR